MAVFVYLREKWMHKEKINIIGMPRLPKIQIIHIGLCRLSRYKFTQILLHSMLLSDSIRHEKWRQSQANEFVNISLNVGYKKLRLFTKYTDKTQMFISRSKSPARQKEI